MIEPQHIPGHQQALIKNNICVAVLTFETHSTTKFNEVFANFDYDSVVDGCEVNLHPMLDAIWNGSFFAQKPASSWSVGEDLRWVPPIPRPGDNYWWDEVTHSWVEVVLPETGN